MEKQSGHIQLGGNQLYYIRYGNDQRSDDKQETPHKILLTFHGFGQDKTVYQSVATALAPTYIVYSFDLFFHGQSKWGNPASPLAQKDWKALLDHFLHRENVSTFSVMGFSMGGKFALASLMAFPERVETLWLLAPDGIRSQFWYSLATATPLSRRLFYHAVFQPKAFHRLSHVAYRLRLTHPKLIRFAQSQVDTSEKRQRLYYSWVNTRTLRVSVREIARLLNERNIPTYIFLGKYDRLIEEQDVWSLQHRLQNCQVRILESGHSTLLEHVADYLHTHKTLFGS